MAMKLKKSKPSWLVARVSRATSALAFCWSLLALITVGIAAAFLVPNMGDTFPMSFVGRRDVVDYSVGTANTIAICVLVCCCSLVLSLTGVISAPRPTRMLSYVAACLISLTVFPYSAAVTVNAYAAAGGSTGDGDALLQMIPFVPLGGFALGWLSFGVVSSMFSPPGPGRRVRQG